MLKEKPKTEVIEVPDEGLVALLGKQVLLMCVNYFYTGKLVGVDAQSLPADVWYVALQSIESYGEPATKIVLS